MTLKNNDFALQQNQYLQASHSLLTWIETSKSRIEQIVDEMPNCFVIIDSRGEIKKANETFGELVGRSSDACLGMNVLNTFSAEDQRLLQQAIAFQLQPHLKLATQETAQTKNGNTELSENGFKNLNGAKYSIETVVNSVTDGKRNILWQLSKFDTSHKDVNGWFSLHGTDVTELRAYEAKLVHVFAALPIGVLLIDSVGKISGPYSNRAPLLLGEANLNGRSLHEVLFAKCWDEFNPQQKAGVGMLFQSLGAPEIQFELVKDEIPKLLRFPSADQKSHLWLSVTLQARSENGILTGLLVLIEDRTAFEELNEKIRFEKRLEDANALRYFEVMRLDSSLIASVLNDLRVCIPKLSLSESNCPSDLDLARVLHRLKGTARFARLSFLKEMCHEAEELVLSKQFITESSSSMLFKEKVTAVYEEALRVERLAKWAAADLKAYNRVNSPKFQGIEELERKIEKLAFETAKAAEKKLKFKFDSSAWSLATELWPEAEMDALSEALVHIVTNAVDHGIESVQERLLAGKNAEGNLHLTLFCDGRSIQCEVQDDGQGLVWHKIIDKGISSGLLIAERKSFALELLARKFKDAETLRELDELCSELIFSEGFSSQDKVTESSGRGIGLGAARRAIEARSGKITVKNAPGNGLKLSLEIPVLLTNLQQ